MIYTVNGSEIDVNTESVYNVSGGAIELDVDTSTKLKVPEDNDIPTVGIVIDGGLPQDKSEGEVPASIYFKCGTSEFHDYCTLKVQGDSSQVYPKKNYTIKLFSDANRTKKDKRVFRNWEEANKFVLKANWIDHSHARNIVNARLWTQIVQSRSDYDSLPEKLVKGHKAIDGFPIKVFANGIYQGLYTWNVPKSGLYGLDDDIDTNALVQGDDWRYTGALIWRAASDTNNQWSDETHDTKPAVITTGWNRVLAFVYNSSDSDFVSQFSNYFDKQSVIDQYIFIYAGCIVDNLAKNQTFFTYDANKWYGGMYDMDGTWGCPPFPANKSTWYDYNTAFQSGYTVSTDGGGATNLLYEKVGRLFANDIKARYAELRQTVLSDANIDAEFDRFMSVIPPYLYVEDYAETTGEGAFTNIPLKDSNNAIQVRQFIKARLDYVDNMLLFDDQYLQNRLLLFEDNFSGNVVNNDSWDVEVGNVRGDTFLRKPNVSIDNNQLVLQAKREQHLTFSWTTGGICGLGHRSWMYGRFDAKIKFPGEVGAFPAFWCLGYGAHEGYTNDDGTQAYTTQSEGDSGNREGWPKCGEIDITEGIPGNTNRPPCNLWDADGNSLGSTPFTQDINTKEWHIYSMEWTPEYMAMLIDGVEYKRWTWSNYDYDTVKAYMTKPMSILLTCGAGSASGTPASTSNLFKMYVDWVRVYAPSNVTAKIPVVSVTMTETFRLKKQFKKYFVPVILPLNASDQYLKWSSSDENIVRVEHGMVYGVNYGTATISATSSNGKTATCEVTVVDTL